ncbi:MAG: S-layer homology domain-containing protein [Rothia mucilaginosa]|uniref:S-layer homology domain-containing protein n=1 Tax=Rothia mucilaginosa TaxID=43675 RepID=A0A930LF77_9MICC|nr:S-layer homology domain-containing protein [Rothia mucilaginosa]MBF1663103.1 S-layer homology domain-containing protein [Rothia mucilaginosa]
MALRPRTVKAGSLAAIAVPSVLGSTLVAPASAFAPVVQDIPGAATATQAPKSLFTSTVQPTLSQVAVQIRQQAEQVKQAQQAPATTAVQPIQKTYTAQVAQPAQATQQAAPSATFQSAQAAQAAQPSAQPTLAQVAQTPAATQNVAPTAQPAQAAQSASGVAATRTNQTFLSYTSPAGTTSQYHVYAEGVDFSKPVGVVFYFDGDYWRNDQSKVYDPSGELAQMAASAAAQNMLFVPVISPDTNRYDAGVSWWEDMERNGEFFRSFASSFIAANGVDSSNVWTMGYSGGAEFITYELNTKPQTWRNGGGSIMVAGGGLDEGTPSAALKSQPMFWYANSNDGTGETYPQTWSARGAVEGGYDAYLAAGYTNASATVLNGSGHFDYNFSQILSNSLSKGKATAAPKVEQKAEQKSEQKSEQKQNTQRARTMSSATYQSYTSPAGTTSQYHVYANNLDYSKPVGVVFYFDGDYWQRDESKVYTPDEGMLAAMGKIANVRNMVFVPIISPDTNASGDGITWWEDMNTNGEFFRSFASSFIGQNNLDASQVWTMGYSGGAEFITYELTDHNTAWRNGGGSIMVAGGDSDGSVDADATTKASPMYWWVGAKDTSGNTYPVTWSARGAVESGYNAYLGAGFSDARVKLIDGFSHHDYDLPHILASSLDFAGKTPALGYTDVSSSNPNYNEISWNSDRRIMLGFADGTFRPNASVNRAQLATYLYRVAGRPAVNAPAVSPFSDVPANHPAYKEIFWLSQQGINGSDFRPLEAVTESTMAEFMYRAAGSPAQAQGGYASQALAWAASNGIGTGSTSSAAITRDAMAGYLYIYAN